MRRGEERRAAERLAGRREWEEERRRAEEGQRDGQRKRGITSWKRSDEGQGGREGEAAVWVERKRDRK